MKDQEEALLLMERKREEVVREMCAQTCLHAHLLIKYNTIK